MCLFIELKQKFSCTIVYDSKKKTFVENYFSNMSHFDRTDNDRQCCSLRKLFLAKYEECWENSMKKKMEIIKSGKISFVCLTEVPAHFIHAMSVPSFEWILLLRL